ncbi:MAG: type sorting protein [Flaviaesturariibacter sp.]|nr:type sorting protein [Flaviaesturariibacter sp.]
MKRFLLILLLACSATLAQAQSRVSSAQDGVAVLRFYPNPATSFVNFEFEKAFEKGYSIQIFNVLGRKMYQASNLNQRTYISLTDFERGIYVYQLFDRNGKMVESRKFQVSK